MAWYILVAVIAYLIGSINCSILISKKMAGFDVREKGSGNAGTTNVLRTVGKKAAALTLLGDILKGVVSVLVAVLVGTLVPDINRAILVELAAFFAAIGHAYPIYFGFKGGKAVATSLGILLVVNWKIGLICLLFGVLIIALTRMVSLGSITGAVLFAVLTIFIHDSYIAGIPYDYTFIIFGFALASFVIFKHRSNLKRIIAGNENKISFSKKKEAKVEEKTEVKKEEKVEEKVEKTNKDPKETK